MRLDSRTGRVGSLAKLGTATGPLLFLYRLIAGQPGSQRVRQVDWKHIWLHCCLGLSHEYDVLEIVEA